MRVLYLCHRIPYPPDKGDKIRAFHQLRAIAARHEVDLFTSESRAGFELLSDPRVTGVHLWGKSWADRGMRFESVPEQSVAGYLKKLVLEPN